MCENGKNARFNVLKQKNAQINAQKRKIAQFNVRKWEIVRFNVWKTKTASINIPKDRTNLSKNHTSTAHNVRKGGVGRGEKGVWGENP